MPNLELSVPHKETHFTTILITMVEAAGVQWRFPNSGGARQAA